jgi:hypothetical protein
MTQRWSETVLVFIELLLSHNMTVPHARGAIWVQRAYDNSLTNKKKYIIEKKEAGYYN